MADDGDGRATPYEDALSALTLEEEDDEGEQHNDGPASLASARADDDDAAAAAAETAAAPPAVTVTLDAAVPAVVDQEDEGEPEQASPVPSRLLDPSKPKHVLVLSNAGKPVFSRHGDEQRLAPLMGMVQAIISLTAAEDEEGGGASGGGGGGGDCVRSIATAGGQKLVFLARGELYLLAVARTGEPEPYLKLQLEYVYQQIVLLLTARRIARCFAANPSYDLRDLLSGTHAVLSSVVDMADPSSEQAGSLLTGAVGTVPLEPTLREDISRTLAALCDPSTNGSSGSNNPSQPSSSLSAPNNGNGTGQQPPQQQRGRMLYAILLCGRRLAALVQPREPHLHLRGSDLLILVNFVAATPAFRQTESSWTPLCLPGFNDTGFLYAYVGYLDVAAEVALLLVSASDDPEQFKACCHARAKVEAVLRDRRWLPALIDAGKPEARARVLNRYSNAAMAFHFLYKHCPVPPSETAAGGGGSGGAQAPSQLLALPQCVASSFFFPYIDDRAKQTIWNKYARSLLQLRYGGQACWVHAGDATDRLLPLRRGAAAAAARDSASTTATTDSLSSSGTGGGSMTSAAAAAAPAPAPAPAPARPPTMVDVFNAPAEHSLVYEIRETDCVLVNVGADYELYALMSAAPDLQETINGLNRLIRAIKRDERFLFLVDAVYW